MTVTPIATSDADPACPLVARRAAFAAIPRATWDALLARTAQATPFSRWTVHRAWWDAYGETAHEEYLLVTSARDADDVRGIVPLMHRHEVEAGDASSATNLRHASGLGGTRIAGSAKAIFFGASYHADYATVLCDPSDLGSVCAAIAARFGEPEPAEGSVRPWDVIDLRRFRADDPALPVLEEALSGEGERRGWSVRREQEDVCPVVTLPDERDWDAYLDTLDKKARHEIRRKIRRAEAAGPNRFELLEPTAAAIDDFIDLHQARWGDDGLFPPTPGGERSRRFVHRFAELELAEGDRRQLQLGRFSVGQRVVLVGLGFEDATTCYFYNAGMDPAARDLSPGVTGTAAYIRDRLEQGTCRRFDFLRGNEAYKYEWGAVDEPVFRLLVTREASR
jgi:CelD/BcsL family acetyltransferase involved in cellulose biosynthesis